MLTDRSSLMEETSKLRVSLPSMSRFMSTWQSLTRTVPVWCLRAHEQMPVEYDSRNLVYHPPFALKSSYFFYYLLFIWKPEVLRCSCQSPKLNLLFVLEALSTSLCCIWRGWHQSMLYLRNVAFVCVVFGVFNIVCLVFWGEASALVCVVFEGLSINLYYAWGAQRWSLLNLMGLALVCVVLQGLSIDLPCTDEFGIGLCCI